MTSAKEKSQNSNCFPIKFKYLTWFVLTKDSIQEIYYFVCKIVECLKLSNQIKLKVDSYLDRGIG